MKHARSQPVTGHRSGGAIQACARRLAGLPRDEAGGMALEYGLVAPAFIALLLAILHVALIYFAQEGLETAVEGGARLIMTGEAQTTVLTNSSGKAYTGMTAADFKSAICTGLTAKGLDGVTPVTYAKSLPPFLACDRLGVNVQVVPSSCATPAITAPTSSGGGYGTVTCTGNSSGTGLSATQGQLVILQLTYLWPTMSLPLGFNLTTQSGGAGNRLLLATYVFTVESYVCKDGTTTTC